MITVAAAANDGLLEAHEGSICSSDELHFKFRRNNLFGKTLHVPAFELPCSYGYNRERKNATPGISGRSTAQMQNRSQRGHIALST